MNTYILLSSLDVNIKDNIIQKTILKLTNKENPRLLYIPATVPENQFNIINFKNHFNKLDVIIDVCILTKDETSSINDKVKNADIIFLGGGSTKILLELIKKHQLDKLFSNLNHKVICGLSAGANAISKFGIADGNAFFDKYKFYNFEEINGLGLLDVFVCPHFNKKELIKFNDILKTKNLDAFAIEDNTAIIFKENKIYALKNDNTKSVYYYLYKENFIMKELRGEKYYEYNKNN